LNKFDLLSDNDNDYNVNADPRDIESELQEYCVNLFLSKKEAIKDLILAHYFDLDENKFEIKYHKQYQIERSSLKVNAQNLGTISNDYEEEGESDDEQGENGGEMTREQLQQAMLDQHRAQFKAAIQIIKQEKSAGRTDYNHLVFVLQANDIGYAAIDDVLKYARKSGFIGDNKGCLSDIDNSSNSDIDQDSDGADQEFMRQAFGEQGGEHVAGEIQMQKIRQSTYNIDESM